jgi:hypothetical protein
MYCSNCHFENPEGMNFCGQCGIKLNRLEKRLNSFRYYGDCGIVI